ncbi:MAG: GNAT family N-acetyltransferase [Pseudomonadota bacterium]
MDLSQNAHGLGADLVTPIATDRLNLRVPTLTDADWLTWALADPRVMGRLTSLPVPFERHHAVNWITKARVPGSARVISLGDNPMGVVHIGPDLVYWLTPDVWGRGCAAEAASALVDWYFSQTDADSLASGYMTDNGQSGRILLNLGFKTGRQAPRRCNLRKRGVMVQSMNLGREDWHARRALPNLATPRLRLRPMSKDDAPDLAALAGVPEVAPMIFRAKVPWPIREVEQFIADWAWTGAPHLRLGVTLPDGTLIGSVGLSREPNVFYFFHKDHWGRGYACEAMRTFIRACYREFPSLDELGADVFQENTGSMAVMNKLGFVQTGTAMGTSAARVEPAPVNVYRLTRATFRDIP